MQDLTVDLDLDTEDEIPTFEHFAVVSDEQAKMLGNTLASLGFTEAQAIDFVGPNVAKHTSLTISKLQQEIRKQAFARETGEMVTDDDDDEMAITIWFAQSLGRVNLVNSLQAVVDSLPDRAVLRAKMFQARRALGNWRPTADDWKSFRGTQSAHSDEIPETLTALSADGVGLETDLDGLTTEEF